jgi:hypothetical protein
MQGRMLRQVLDKMMQTGTAQNARVQVCLPDGKYYDITVLDALSKVPKLYEGSCIRNLVACGLTLEPKVSGFKEIENYLSLLDA